MLSDEQKKSLESAVLQYQADLEHALPYLDSRGIGRDTALTRQLGFVTTPATPEHNHAKGRLAIPYLTKAGAVGITFRCIQDHSCRSVEKHSKYVKPRGQLTSLYGVNDFFGTHLDIHIAEGEIDAITLSELCGLEAIGIPGADNWQDWWALNFEDYRHVYIYCDGDQAGEQMGNRVANKLKSKAVIIHLPKGEDVNSFYLKYGPEALKELKK